MRPRSVPRTASPDPLQGSDVVENRSDTPVVPALRLWPPPAGEREGVRGGAAVAERVRRMFSPGAEMSGHVEESEARPRELYSDTTPSRVPVSWS